MERDEETQGERGRRRSIAVMRQRNTRLGLGVGVAKVLFRQFVADEFAHLPDHDVEAGRRLLEAVHVGVLVEVRDKHDLLAQVLPQLLDEADRRRQGHRLVAPEPAVHLRAGLQHPNSILRIHKNQEVSSSDNINSSIAIARS